MKFKKQIGERVVLTDFPEYGNNNRIHLTIRQGWNDSCQWNANSLSLEEAHDLHYALGRLLALAAP